MLHCGADRRADADSESNGKTEFHRRLPADRDCHLVFPASELEQDCLRIDAIDAARSRFHRDRGFPHANSRLA
jgi:hypothetical protein